MGKLDAVDVLKAGEKTTDMAKNAAKTGENITEESKDIAKNSDGVKTKENQSGTINKKADEATDVAKQASNIEKGAVDNVAEAGNATRKFVGEAADEGKDLEKIVEETIDDVSEGAERIDNPITKSEYSSLRKKTPNSSIRKMVNPEGTKIDPVYGYETNVLEADHIVPMKEIVNMPGFSQLSKEQQVEVLNLKDNFIGLGKSTNASKGAKNWTDWQGHSKLGEIPSDVRTRMLELDAIAREALMKAIEERLKK